MAYEFETLKGDLYPAREQRLLTYSVSSEQKKVYEIFIREYKREVKSLQAQGVLPVAYSAPLGIQLELTHKCNLNCIHCYNDSSGQTDTLSIEDWKRIAHEAVELGVYECVITGGEPTIFPGLREVMDILYDGGVRMVMITNGLTMTRALAKQMASYKLNWVQVSCDGLDAETHDTIRKKKGSWKHVIMAARYLVEEDIPVIVAHSVFRDQIENVSDFVDMIGCLGCAETLIGEPLPVGRAAWDDEVSNSIVYSEEDQRLFIDVLQRKKAEWDGKMIVASPMPPYLAVKLESIEPNQVLLLRPNGDVRLNCITPFLVGNVKNKSLSQVWEQCKLAYKNEKIHAYGDEICETRDLMKSKFGITHKGKQTNLY
ncbi:MAG: radical SAM protein [Candidatus Scalindua sp.]|nr:radical SAM protein [Candidatus Scalindua sp.]